MEGSFTEMKGAAEGINLKNKSYTSSSTLFNLHSSSEILKLFLPGFVMNSNSMVSQNNVS